MRASVRNKRQVGNKKSRSSEVDFFLTALIVIEYKRKRKIGNVCILGVWRLNLLGRLTLGSQTWSKYWLLIIFHFVTSRRILQFLLGHYTAIVLLKLCRFLNPLKYLYLGWLLLLLTTFLLCVVYVVTSCNEAYCVLNMHQKVCRYIGIRLNSILTKIRHVIPIQEQITAPPTSQPTQNQPSSTDPISNFKITRHL